MYTFKLSHGVERGNIDASYKAVAARAAGMSPPGHRSAQTA
jgi:hypothetical protein